MSEKEIERLLGKKEETPSRENASLILSPEITRNAMRLKKRRQDRLQALCCALAGLVFLLAAGGIMMYLERAADPAAAARQLIAIAGGAMGMTLLLAPMLAWCTDEA